VLLRGINIGPHKRISMPDLRAMFDTAGLAGARTYVQSGNVVLDSELAPEELASLTERLIAERFALDVPVVVRTGTELAAVVRRNPFAGTDVPDKLHTVSFLDREAPDDLTGALAALAAGGERFAAIGREWYGLFPNGSARSKLAMKMASAGVGVTVTARNWTTVTSLLEMVGAQ
jgi:uncharacterized protein (DUF1697 family)